MLILCTVVLLAGCRPAGPAEVVLPEPDLTITRMDTSRFLRHEEVYVPVYSDIYNFDETTRFLLTVTLSLRNTSTTDSLYISKVDYYDSRGDLLRNYLSGTIVLRPLESVDFVVENREQKGGTGANFLVNWGSIRPITHPVIQAVMIGTTSQQGISFVTEGVTIRQKALPQ